MPRLLLVLIPILLLSACASPDRKVIATRHTTLHQQTLVAEYPIPTPQGH